MELNRKTMNFSHDSLIQEKGNRERDKRATQRLSPRLYDLRRHVWNFLYPPPSHTSPVYHVPARGPFRRSVFSLPRPGWHSFGTLPFFTPPPRDPRPCPRVIRRRDLSPTSSPNLPGTSPSLFIPRMSRSRFHLACPLPSPTARYRFAPACCACDPGLL